MVKKGKEGKSCNDSGRGPPENNNKSELRAVSDSAAGSRSRRERETIQGAPGKMGTKNSGGKKRKVTPVGECVSVLKNEKASTKELYKQRNLFAQRLIKRKAKTEKKEGKYDQKTPSNWKRIFESLH